MIFLGYRNRDIPLCQHFSFAIDDFKLICTWALWFKHIIFKGHFCCFLLLNDWANKRPGRVVYVKIQTSITTYSFIGDSSTGCHVMTYFGHPVHCKGIQTQFCFIYIAVPKRHLISTDSYIYIYMVTVHHGNPFFISFYFIKHTHLIVPVC